MYTDDRRRGVGGSRFSNIFCKNKMWCTLSKIMLYVCKYVEGCNLVSQVKVSPVGPWGLLLQPRLGYKISNYTCNNNTDIVLYTKQFINKICRYITYI